MTYFKLFYYRKLLKYNNFSDLPFGQVPAVKIDGKLLVQSDAIVRHFARLYELNGRNEEERFR